DEPAPPRAGAALQPGSVHAVAGAAGIARPHALEGKEQVAVRVRVGGPEGVGKAARRAAGETMDLTLPRLFRPMTGGQQDDLVPRGPGRAREPAQIGFHASGAGKAATN